MSERSARGRTDDGFIVIGAAPVANGFGYFCPDKSDPRDSAEAFDLAKQRATSMDSRLRGNDEQRVASIKRRIP